MKLFRTLNARLVLSHLAVSIASITLMAIFAGRSLSQAASTEAEHKLQGLAFAAGNALVLPLQEYREGSGSIKKIQDLLETMFSDDPNLVFTLYKVDGTPLLDSSAHLPPKANSQNAPEVFGALGSGLGTATTIRKDSRGQMTMYVAVLVQREIEVTGILRLGTPMGPVRDAARRSLFVLIFAALIITSGVSLFGWVLANNIARPIQQLTQAAAQMGRGDLNVRVKPSGPEELQRLGEAFNSMASRLQSFVNELRAFVPNASHELRTPLTVVKLRTEALCEGALEDPEVARKFLDEINTEVDRLVRMVNDLLDLSRMDAGLESNKRTTVNLNAIANEVFETFKIRASRAGVNLTLELEPGLPPVMGHEDQLRRVFYNLLENAIKYTPEGGQVELILRPGSKENTVRILVRDSGPGIPPEHLPHVFERFYRAETSQQQRPGAVRGSGLGLAIVKSIVENHNGEIGVSSQMGYGTTFWADLPSIASLQNNKSA
jgi:signal transduction histidine kinase